MKKKYVIIFSLATLLIFGCAEKKISSINIVSDYDYLYDNLDVTCSADSNYSATGEKACVFVRSTLPGFKQRVYRSVIGGLQKIGYTCVEAENIDDYSGNCGIMVSVELYFRGTDPYDPNPYKQKDLWIIESIFIKANDNTEKIIWQVSVSDSRIQKPVFAGDLIDAALKKMLLKLTDKIKK